MYEPDAIPEHRKRRVTRLAMATLAGATVVALTMPSVAQADPEPSPEPAPPPPSGNTFMQGPPADPNAPPPPADPAHPAARPTPMRRHHRRPIPNAPPPLPADPNAPAACRGRSQRARRHPGARARPCRQRRGRLQLCGACGLEGLRRHPAVVRPGAADQGSPRERRRPNPDSRPAARRTTPAFCWAGWT